MSESTIFNREFPKICQSPQFSIGNLSNIFRVEYGPGKSGFKVFSTKRQKDHFSSKQQSLHCMLPPGKWLCGYSGYKPSILLVSSIAMVSGFSIFCHFKCPHHVHHVIISVFLNNMMNQSGTVMFLSRCVKINFLK